MIRDEISYLLYHRDPLAILQIDIAKYKDRPTILESLFPNKLQTIITTSGIAVSLATLLSILFQESFGLARGLAVGFLPVVIAATPSIIRELRRRSHLRIAEYSGSKWPVLLLFDHEKPTYAEIRELAQLLDNFRVRKTAE